MFKAKFRKQTAFALISKISEYIQTLKNEKEYVIEVKEFREKRSLSANSYYWVLIEKLSKALNISKDELHEIMLQSYGTLLRDENNNLLGISTENELDCVKTGIHARFRGTSELNGKTFFHYYVIKGSRFYNSKEMSELIRGLVEECKNCNIETLTPEELARLRYE